MLSPEAAGDLCVLPHGRASPELFLALRALGAPAAEFDAWRGAADALRGGRAGGGGRGGKARAATVDGAPLSRLLRGGGGGGDSSSDDDSGDGDGSSGDSGSEDGERRRRRPSAIAERFQEVAIGGSGGAVAALWSPAMARALLAALAEREGRYPPGSSLGGDRAALAALEKGGGGGGGNGSGGRGGGRRASERAAAARGALRLRVAERSLLAAAAEAARALL